MSISNSDAAEIIERLKRKAYCDGETVEVADAIRAIAEQCEYPDQILEILLEK